MKIKPIRTEADYDAALRAIEKYFDRPPRKGTPEADRFDVLATLIEAYERKRWPIDPPSPVDAILYRMETAGYTQGDLARLLGSRSRASEVLNRNRPLTLAMIRKLSREWNIPADCLIDAEDRASA
ncbi:MAG: type II toxin-antitoxin system HigA family antitoxin [Reyranellaceae bacterium]